MCTIRIGVPKSKPVCLDQKRSTRVSKTRQKNSTQQSRSSMRGLLIYLFYTDRSENKPTHYPVCPCSKAFPTSITNILTSHNQRINYPQLPPTSLFIHLITPQSPLIASALSPGSKRSNHFERFTSRTHHSCVEGSNPSCSGPRVMKSR